MNDKFVKIVNEITESGWSVTENFLPPDSFSCIQNEIIALWNDGIFRQAGIGRGETYNLKSEIRRDKIMWLDGKNLPGSIKFYWNEIENLMNFLNRTLFLSLIEFEAHYAVYPIGSFYKKHLDQFKDLQYRLITCILYLNSEWDKNNGGQLKIYLNNSKEYIDIYPSGNTFVCFRSDLIYHEVLPTLKERYSITGWLRRREYPL